MKNKVGISEILIAINGIIRPGHADGNRVTRSQTLSIRRANQLIQIEWRLKCIQNAKHRIDSINTVVEEGQLQSEDDIRELIRNKMNEEMNGCMMNDTQSMNADQRMNQKIHQWVDEKARNPRTPLPDMRQCDLSPLQDVESGNDFVNRVDKLVKTLPQYANENEGETAMIVLVDGNGSLSPDATMQSDRDQHISQAIQTLERVRVSFLHAQKQAIGNLRQHVKQIAKDTDLCNEQERKKILDIIKSKGNHA